MGEWKFMGRHTIIDESPQDIIDTKAAKMGEDIKFIEHDEV
jgi:hypothetical protein